LPTRVAAIQFGLGKQNYDQAVENAEKLVRAAAGLGASIVCFPEHWLLEYREHGHLATERLSQAARDSSVFVITGANYMPNTVPTSPELRVRSLVIDSQGKVLGQQDKVHLYKTEKKIATPGNKYEVIQTPFGKIGILICYDCMFPEAARTLALKGADLMFAPSRIGYAALDQWIIYLKTRALENRVPIIAPNVFRPPRYVGGTVIVDPTEETDSKVVVGKVVGSAGSGENVIVADVNVEHCRELRRERFLDRRPTAYFGH
jgi:predicted amidohydrolase